MRIPLAYPLILLLVSAVWAGCIAEDDPNDDVPAGDPPDPRRALLEAVSFTPKHIIDDVRAGGEPVIAVSHDGSLLVSAHPGWTHYHPSGEPTHPGTELVTPANAQSYLWKSTDGGQTWQHIGLPTLEEGPRSTGFGVSDPDFTVMEDGTICYTDLEGLAMSSVSCSMDDGETWIGNPVASQRPNDRQWLASHGDELYFTANFFTDHDILASTDRGLTWERRGDVPCSYDLIAHPADGTLLGGCGNGLAVSTDGGWTWVRKESDFSNVRRDMTEPAIDSAGNVWMAFATDTGGPERIVVAGTPDQGETWPWVIDLAGLDSARNATRFTVVDQATSPPGSAHIWPWISAGANGTLAVTWIGTDVPEAQPTDAVDWHIYTALILNATDDKPAVGLYRVSDLPIHQRPICQSGTTCQVSSMQGDQSGDRRLGDFFETTIDHAGNLHVVVSDTVAKPDDVISHVAYFQSTGVALVAPDDRRPTQG